MNQLIEKKCNFELGNQLLTKKSIETQLKELEGWRVNEQLTEIECMFAFKDFYETISFVNAVAYLSHCENHHPHLEVSYSRCRVRYTTHSLKGLSQNDFICATKVDALISIKS